MQQQLLTGIDYKGFKAMTKLFQILTLIVLTTLMSACNKAIDKERTPVVDAKLTLLGYQAKQAQINNHAFRYVEAGNGELILFLHGFPFFGESWDKLLKPLSQQYRVIAPDGRGYGYSDKPELIEDYKIEQLVNDVQQFIFTFANSKSQKVTLVGHDWGGVLAWGVAQQYPELINKVVVINAPPFNAFLSSLVGNHSQREASHYIPKMTGLIAKAYFMYKGEDVFWGASLENMYQAGHIDESFKKTFLASWQQPRAVTSAVNWYKANIPAFDDINESTYWPPRQASLENKIKVPSLLIWSKDDKAFTDDTFNEIPKFVDNMQIKIIDTDSHAPQLDHSEEVLGYIVDFLQPSK